MYDIIKCYRCNTSLGEFYSLYNAMKHQLYEDYFNKELDNVDVFKLELNDNVNINTAEIFDILNINNYCCRTIILTNIEIKSYINY